ncbi:uncharacterized protein TEOVI_000767900 [Trypanosoma equiperdum]|uniref:Uncharacterized protein n=1 Tax=Trypanosoma equiperdum TaxID=5694 RepID=A0A1G4I052_TRYEQ|nr:hypothetical protein, conserved [Trypanosoma equiperdum]
MFLSAVSLAHALAMTQFIRRGVDELDCRASTAPNGLRTAAREHLITLLFCRIQRAVDYGTYPITAVCPKVTERLQADALMLMSLDARPCHFNFPGVPSTLWSFCAMHRFARPLQESCAFPALSFRYGLIGDEYNLYRKW